MLRFSFVMIVGGITSFPLDKFLIGVLVGSIIIETIRWIFR